ncbi:hypothetical protein, unlikely [Trypanosoma brucei gambiense DAL972]|uniref:Uncharacterized protein n=1 Tax=Trypanosoma brucei gambiense (strain MHOM/CI/86/DAL972) TaxID=679716 RepID=D0A162_TRYB9|nr:hypothetical protein, unlikely [Trypanosoma brucei gambiense DAL972]CBH15004.1 hypothetical protein, unlikely [Trypanosoma brucei gambiense DAL972]|eukprot:XP_011777270.1 hypothetical protein, unlikely [Trypanosoma brucei gambiense DAL972]
MILKPHRYRPQFALFFLLSFRNNYSVQRFLRSTCKYGFSSTSLSLSLFQYFLLHILSTLIKSWRSEVKAHERHYNIEIKGEGEEARGKGNETIKKTIIIIIM